MFEEGKTEQQEQTPAPGGALTRSRDNNISKVTPTVVATCNDRNDAPPHIPSIDLRDELTRSATPTAAPDLQPSVVFTPVRAPERYEILAEHGRGGIGRVSRAHDRELGRDVAIKELISRSSVAEIRFLREALITARLEHPGIVPVHEAGRWPDGTPFYAMKLVSGRSLRDLILERPTVDQRIGLLHHVIAVADAMAYAHGRNIIHRDLKPANVIVGDFGETIVIDWGLAKNLSVSDESSIDGRSVRAEGDCDLTTAGAILGTPSYMAPEQERGEQVDQRADVFAIGAMLWELCSLHKVPPTNLRQRHRFLRRSGIDQDLSVILDKALDVEPSRRYPHAGALAADLKAFKSGARISARSYSLPGMLSHWTRRHRALALSVSAATVVAIVIGIFYVRTIATERDRADAALARVEAANSNLAVERAVAIEQRNRLILAQATAALDSDPTLAIEWLKTYPAEGADWGRAQTIAADAQSRGIARHIVPTMAQMISISPDGKALLTAGPLELVSLWDLATGRLLRSVTLSAPVTAAQFAPDGKTIAISSRGGDVVMWNVAEDTRMLLGRLDGGALYILFSPDGKKLASSSLNAVQLWDLTSARRLWSLSSARSITSLAMSPNGRMLAVGTSDGALDLRDLAHGDGQRMTGHKGAVNIIAFSPDGTSILTGGRDHTLRLWEVGTGRGRVLGSHDGLVRDACFSPVDPTLAASGGADNKVRLWSLTGKGSRVFSGHTDMVNGVLFSPDGKTLASVSPDRQVRLWDVATGDSRLLSGHRGDLGGLIFSPDGSIVVSAGYDEGTRVWPLAPPYDRLIGRHEFEALHAVFSPSGELIASAGSDRTARLWNLLSSSEQVLAGTEYSAMVATTGVVFSANGESLASVGDNTAHLWNLKERAVRSFTARDTLLRKVAITADASLIAAAGSDGSVRLWEVKTQRMTVLTGHRGEVTALAFLPRGDRVISGGTDGAVRLWNLSTLEAGSQVLASDGASITQLAVASFGGLFASAARDGTIHLFTQSSSMGRVFSGHSGSITGLAFSPDGRLLASSSVDKTARVWNVASGAVVILQGHDEALRTVAFAPDGKTLATGANDKTARLWNLETGAIAILRGHRAAVRSVAFDPTGRQLVTASEDATVRLWDVGRVALVPRDSAGLVPWLDAQTSAALPDQASTSLEKSISNN